MNLKAALVGAAVAAALLMPGSSQAATISGVIQNPCVTPVPTLRGITPQGACGYLITPVPDGSHFKLTPSKPADLDVAYYAADNSLLDAYAGPGPLGFGCGGFTNKVSEGAVKAVIVATPSMCMNQPGWSFDGSERNIGFTYTTW